MLLTTLGVAVTLAVVVPAASQGEMTATRGVSYGAACREDDDRLSCLLERGNGRVPPGLRRKLDPAPATTTTSTTTAPATTTAAATTEPTTNDATAQPSGSTVTPPTDSPAPVCGDAALTSGPEAPPDGAVRVAAGNNSGIDFSRAGTTYWFAPGVHTLGSGAYSQIVPGDNATFLGAPGAVIDGQGVNHFAFTQRASGVTIKFLTITGFVAPRQQGVVNHDSGNGWVVAKNVIKANSGAALMAGDDNRIIGNCIKNNGQYGLNAYQAGDGPTDLVVAGNEFVGNNIDDWEAQVPGCGCAGGMKFWSVDGATVRGNWVHDNRGPGVWADNNNNDFVIEANLIEANDGMGIFYEQSYNGTIRDNVLRDNAWVTGREFADRGDNFPIGAIYVSESGGDPRIPAHTDSLEITENLFLNNWGGVVGWENADRFCNSPANTGSDCTLPMGGDQSRVDECSQPGIANAPLYDDCRWKTQRLDVHHNEFRFDPSQVDGGCPTAFCGRQALFANWGSYPSWSPYQGRTVQEAITFEQNNRWHDNTYEGPWRFVPFETGRVLTLAQWQAAPYSQDAGSS